MRTWGGEGRKKHTSGWTPEATVQHQREEHSSPSVTAGYSGIAVLRTGSSNHFPEPSTPLVHSGLSPVPFLLSHLPAPHHPLTTLSA